MAILHGSWIPEGTTGSLFIWGETWRTKASLDSVSTNGVSIHPFAMTQAELTSFLHFHGLPLHQFIEASGRSRQSHQKNLESPGQLQWQANVLALPTQTTSERTAYPVLSTKSVLEEIDTSPLELQRWQAQGLKLDPLAAVKLLQALPLSSFQTSDTYVGGDLRFWSQVMRWSLDLLSRSKFLPGVYRQPSGEVVARWQPLLDSAVDQARLEKFTQVMPSACRAYLSAQELNGEGEKVEGLEHASNLQPATFHEPQELLLSFLSSVVDTQVRSWVAAQPLPSAEPPMQEWLQALSTQSDTLEAPAEAVERLEAALQTWTIPVQQNLVAPTSQTLRKNLFRTCFVLKPPASGEMNWQLEYGLQAINDPDFWVDAKTIWSQPVEQLEYQGRIIEQPQETFLKGLGLAIRLYPLMEPSLHEPRPASCELTPVEVYEFIKASAWRLQDSGLGIILPPGLAPGAGANRLGISISAEVAQAKKKERLGLQSLLNFKWELAIGDKTISKKEFDRLMARQSPLVEVDGEWIALQPSDVKAAQALFSASQDLMSLRVEDALRLSTGDTTTLAKLPVVHFEASGALQELITNLTGNQSVQLIEIPESFHGTLRPYQVRGVSWLAFLERWGMGACLADDMGLGKTPQLIAFLLHLKEQEALEGPTL
ncbi:MAG: SNF2 helicase-associated domain-containing protein, partial [Cyanobacteriota bacterium]